MWGHNKETAVYEPEKGILVDTTSARTLTLELPDARTMGNKFLLFKSPGLRYCVVAGRTDKDIVKSIVNYR